MNRVPEHTTDTDAASTQSLFAGFLRRWLNLDTEQVVVANQKWKVPADDRLYLTIGSVAQQRYGSTSEFVSGGTVQEPTLSEVISTASREIISIDLYSRGQAAIDRKDEISALLESTAMQMSCEEWALHVARQPLTFVNASGVDGVAMLNRFHVAIVVLRTRTLSKAVEFYDQFQKPGLVIEP